jgi:hypothetical protein
MSQYTRKCPNDGNSYITTETGWYCGHCGATFWDIYGELKEIKLYEKISRASERQSRVTIEAVPGDEGL